MIIVETPGSQDGLTNMDEDRRSALACVNGRTSAHIRLYGWHPAAVSLGSNQSFEIINSDIAHQHGVDIVSRPTGGGAILHTDELTYCITLPLWGRTPSAVYAVITAALLKGLARLGISADAESWPSAFSPNGPYVRDQLCFSGIARNEIRVRGKKLVGSAQRIYRTPNGDRVILQHGSILLSDAHTSLPVYLNDTASESVDRKVQELRDRSTSITEALCRRPVLDELTAAIRCGFEETPELWIVPIQAAEEAHQEVIA